VRPGYTVIMGDSHTCTHGAFGAFAAGVGTTDLEVGMLKGVCAFKAPDSIRIDLNGKLRDGVYAKDVILAVIAKLGVSGATDKVMEFRGPVVDTMSMEERMTICNMAIEAGGTCGVCMPDTTTADYLWPFVGPAGEKKYATKVDAVRDFKTWWSDADASYDSIVAIDCSQLEPVATFAYKPDQVKTIRELEGTRVDQVYIGSCTNGRIEDLRKAASVLKGRKVADTVRAIVSPATPAIFDQALSEGLIKIFMDAGFCVTNPTCGACLGMSNGVLAEGEVCASTTNRNFFGRMGKGGMVHLMSPVSAANAAVAGFITSAKGGSK
jgi:3-isopropylmalate/(R)-2-methylmalate dehydratase large subunit